MSDRWQPSAVQATTMLLTARGRLAAHALMKNTKSEQQAAALVEETRFEGRDRTNAPTISYIAKQ